MENKPKIGLALSGASGRAVAHIAVLQTLKKHNIPIYALSACSSGAVIASSFLAGTLDDFHETIKNLKKSDVIKLFRPDLNGNGIIKLDRAEEEIRAFTQGKKFEDVDIKASFSGCDIYTGEGVSLDRGDLAHAAAISSAVPGLFTPGIWNNKVVVDGGLHSIVPVDEAKKLGADVVIAVDVAASRFMFNGKYINLWQRYRKYFPRKRKLKPKYDENGRIKKPNLLAMYDMAFSYAVERQRSVDLPESDFLLSPEVKHFGKMEFDKSDLVYERAKKDTEKIIPELKKLLA